MPGNETTGVDIEELRTMIAEEIELPVGDLTDDADLARDFDVDSLAAMEIAVQLEKRYRIKISDEEVKTLTSVSTIHRFVSAKVEAA